MNEISAAPAQQGALPPPPGPFTVISAIMLPMWRNFDELWRRLTIDASAIAGNILLAICVIWGGGAAAGLVAGPHPLDLVSAAFGIFLLATFIAVGRRGMMTPP